MTVFTVLNKPPFYRELQCDSVEDFYEDHPAYTSRLLEASSAGDQRLSAFNLMYRFEDGTSASVECCYQTSKVFENNIQYTDLLHKSSVEAKTDKRLRSSGKLKCFKFLDIEYPLNPSTAFYDWLYINALLTNKELCACITNYRAFTDKFFNSRRMKACQARSLAIFISLLHMNLLKEAMVSFDSFVKTVYN